MRPVREAEVARAGNLWLTDPEAHSTREPGPTSSRSFTQTALRWFRFHDSVDSTVSPGSLFDAALADYLHHLTSRHVSRKTIYSHRSCLSRLFEWARSANIEISTVTVLDVDKYLELKRKLGWTAPTVSAQCAILRTFFRYAESRGWTDSKIARGIRSPRVSRYGPTPRGPSWRDIRRLLAANQGLSARETRTRAVLVLCAIYALRATEVVNLTIDDLDWVNETLIVKRAKHGRTQQFPMQFELGDAILNYLRRGRPHCKCRSLFVTEKPPYHGIGDQTVRNIVKQQMASLGIESKTTGPHSLRHACATQLLRKGSSLRQIADFLGHRDTKSVCIYAKFDIPSLARVASFSLAGVR
jgi:integrase/recombinase XerD